PSTDARRTQRPAARENHAGRTRSGPGSKLLRPRLKQESPSPSRRAFLVAGRVSDGLVQRAWSAGFAAARRPCPSPAGSPTDHARSAVQPSFSNTRQLLCPPKPKLLLIPNRAVVVVATLGTQSTGQSGS